MGIKYYIFPYNQKDCNKKLYSLVIKSYYIIWQYDFPPQNSRPSKIRWYKVSFQMVRLGGVMIQTFAVWGRSLRVSRGLLGGNTVEHDDSVGQICRHDEVMLHHKRRLLGVKDVPGRKKTAKPLNSSAPNRKKNIRATHFYHQQQSFAIVCPFWSIM